MSKKSQVSVGNCVVLENSNVSWRLEAKIVTTNNNALELHIKTPSWLPGTEYTVVLESADLKGISDFGKSLSRIAEDLMKGQESDKK